LGALNNLVMKTLLISGIYRPEIGGPATYLPSLAQYLMHLNHSAEIITLKNRTSPEQKEPWIVNYVNRDQLILIRFLKTVRLIFKKINTIDVILANGLLQETAVVISLIKKRSIAKVVSDPVWERAFNNSETSLGVVEFNTSKLRLKHKLQRKLLKWSLNRFDTITCPSAQLKRIIENWGVYKPIEYIPNGVMLVNKKSTSKDFDLVTVCRLINLKNIDKIIKASSVANVSLAIVGSGSEELKLRELARSTNSRVTFFGQLDTNEVNNVLLRSKIYLNLSDHEGLSFSLLEAMSCGLPSIVSNIQGNTDIISNGLDGIVVNVNDENQLVNAIKTLIDSPSKCLEYGRAARFKIESEYQQETQIGKVVNLLTTEIKK
jgi:glycosyltransferase involved in cell wall biosynthesis